MGNSIRDVYIWINNSILRWTHPRYATADMMILLPRCLQHSGCIQNVILDVSQCKQCGKCAIADIKVLSQHNDITVVVASGGLAARHAIEKSKPKFIIAVACENELLLGLWKTLGKKVYAIINARPNGPCKDTSVDIKEIDSIVRYFST